MMIQKIKPIQESKVTTKMILKMTTTMMINPTKPMTKIAKSKLRQKRAVLNKMMMEIVAKQQLAKRKAQPVSYTVLENCI